MVHSNFFLSFSSSSDASSLSLTPSIACLPSLSSCAFLPSCRPKTCFTGPAPHVLPPSPAPRPLPRRSHSGRDLTCHSSVPTLLPNGPLAQHASLSPLTRLPSVGPRLAASPPANHTPCPRMPWLVLMHLPDSMSPRRTPSLASMCLPSASHTLCPCVP